MSRILRQMAVAVVLLLSAAPAHAAALKIVALGASNTWGWGVPKENSFVARLEVKLRERGIAAAVANAGVPANTTGNMLDRLASAVPEGTDIVVLQPGTNDRRFGVPDEKRAANIAKIVATLSRRNVRVVVYDETIPPDLLPWDGIHFTAAAHEKIAATLAEEIAAEPGK